METTLAEVKQSKTGGISINVIVCDKSICNITRSIVSVWQSTSLTWCSHCKWPAPTPRKYCAICRSNVRTALTSTA
jgi:hypothetical protein